MKHRLFRSFAPLWVFDMILMKYEMKIGGLAYRIKVSRPEPRYILCIDTSKLRRTPPYLPNLHTGQMAARLPH